jgi:hypothetical protein
MHREFEPPEFSVVTHYGRSSSRVFTATSGYHRDKRFRAAVHQLAFTSLSCCAWARDYYDQYRARGHAHHAALRALANVWLRILFPMGKTLRPYDEARFLADRGRSPPGDRFLACCLIPRHLSACQLSTSLT